MTHGGSARRGCRCGMSGKLFRRGRGEAWGNRKLSVICTISRLTIRREAPINAKSEVKIIPSQRHGLTSGVGVHVTLT